MAVKPESLPLFGSSDRELKLKDILFVFAAEFQQNILFREIMCRRRGLVG